MTVPRAERVVGTRLGPERVSVAQALALLLLAWIAWRVVTLGIADHLARRDPLAALSWRPRHPEAALAAARELAGPAGDRARAEELARESLRSYPLLGGGYRILAELASEPERAGSLYRVAAARAPRDIRSLAWLSDRALVAGDYRGAMELIDQILRVEPELFGRLFPALTRIAGVPAARHALAAVLREAPPWRVQFLVRMARHTPDLAAVGSVVELLREGSIGLAEPELNAWLERLIAERQWSAAYFTWVHQLPAEYRNRIGNVYDGGFERIPTNRGFDWRFERVAGARMDLAAIEGMGGRQALRVAFEPRRVPFRHVRQLMALPPGKYRLQGRARPQALETERGLVWTVACAEGWTELAGSEPFSGTRPWREFAVDFEVPAPGCGAQWLTLRIPARIPAEQRIAGTAWFDDMQVARR